MSTGLIDDALDEDLDYTGPDWVEDEYLDYNPADTRVISGPIGKARYPGSRFKTWEEAQTHCQKKYEVISFGTIPGRWLARIKR